MHFLQFARREACRNHQVDAVFVDVFGFEVIELAALDDDFAGYGYSGFAAVASFENGDFDFATNHCAFDNQFAVFVECFFDCIAKFGHGVYFAHANARAGSGRLHEKRKATQGSDCLESGFWVAHP